ncbi:MAG: PAS domain S-box protein, partial [Kiloniellales bacterium]|nr:PAS domain S-box protein [Kiloniellales bacterium]
MQDLTPKVERRRSLLHRYGSEMSRIADRHHADLAIVRGAKLRRADALMRNVVESSFDGIVTLKADGSVATANPSAEAIFNLSKDALTGRNISELLPSLSPETGEHDLESLLQLGNGPMEIEGQRQDGTAVPLEVAVSRTQADGEDLLVAILRDITERRRQQQ